MSKTDDEWLREAIRDLLLRHAKGVLSPRAAEDELFGHITDLRDDARREERRSFERIIQGLRSEALPSPSTVTMRDPDPRTAFDHTLRCELPDGASRAVATDVQSEGQKP